MRFSLKFSEFLENSTNSTLGKRASFSQNSQKNISFLNHSFLVILNDLHAISSFPPTVNKGWRPGPLQKGATSKDLSVMRINLREFACELTSSRPPHVWKVGPGARLQNPDIGQPQGCMQKKNRDALSWGLLQWLR